VSIVHRSAENQPITGFSTVGFDRSDVPRLVIGPLGRWVLLVWTPEDLRPSGPDRRCSCSSIRKWKKPREGQLDNWIIRGSGGGKSIPNSTNSYRTRRWPNYDLSQNRSTSLFDLPEWWKRDVVSCLETRDWRLSHLWPQFRTDEDKEFQS
jgi:hypothetical protein